MPREITRETVSYKLDINTMKQVKELQIEYERKLGLRVSVTSVIEKLIKIGLQNHHFQRD